MPKEFGVLAGIRKQATRERIVVFSVNWQESALDAFVEALATRISAFDKWAIANRSAS